MLRWLSTRKLRLCCVRPRLSQPEGWAVHRSAPCTVAHQWRFNLSWRKTRASWVLVFKWYERPRSVVARRPVLADATAARRSIWLPLDACLRDYALIFPGLRGPRWKEGLSIFAKVVTGWYYVYLVVGVAAFCECQKTGWFSG